MTGWTARSASKKTLTINQRETIYERDDRRCVACSGRVALVGGHVHHRLLRSAGRLDCACNLVLLHSWCHALAHAHPAASRESGLIISRYRKLYPYQIPVRVRDHWEWFSCDGQRLTELPELGEDHGKLA